MKTRLHPLYKDLALRIAKDDKIFYSDAQIATDLEEILDTKEYQFELMGLIQQLLDEHQIDFIRSENEVEGKGYKKATPEESIEVTAERLQRKMRSAINKQRKVLDTIDRSLLSHDMSETYEGKNNRRP